MYDTPDAVGKAETNAGLSMPGRSLSRKRDKAISAPVLPPLTQASAQDSATKINSSTHRATLTIT